MLDGKGMTLMLEVSVSQVNRKMAYYDRKGFVIIGIQ